MKKHKLNCLLGFECELSNVATNRNSRIPPQTGISRNESHRLEALKDLPENLKILQWGEAKNVNSFLDIEQFDLIASLESRLVEILDRALMGTRFYAIGSEQFVWNLRGYARRFGLSEAEIGLEIVSKETKNIYCSNCLVINSLVREKIFICSNCEIKLEVLDHFSRLKNAYLGISADAETLKPSEVKS